MTESDWLACTDPQKMLEYLRDRASDRKLRLFACACCRRVWHKLSDERCRRTVEVVERIADGQGHVSELDQARNKIREICSKGAANRAVWYLAWDDARESAKGPAEEELNETIEALMQHYAEEGDPRDLYDQSGEARWLATATVLGCQADLLHDLFGNPFHPPTLEPVRLSWLDGTFPKLAQVIYDERAFDRLPILADALEDAGCDNADILAHCRQPGEHVRGCWVIDRLLGKD
jgi:hypothetical protein